MFKSKPFFMKNEDWYYFDEEEFCYKLTDKATPEAINSYEEFYSLDNFLLDEQS